MPRLRFVAAAAALLSACAGPSGHPTARTGMSLAPDPEPGWHQIVSAADQARLEQLPEIWRHVLQTLDRPQRRLVAKEGELLDPNAARLHPETPPGSYRCRLVKLGAGGRPAVRGFPEFFCYVRAEKDGSLSFTKQTGSELPGGWLHADGPRRLILTGALQRAPGDNSLAYGAEPDRDLAGVVERIGPFRWRLVLPWRGGEAGLDVYELTPVPVEKQAAEPRP